MGTVINFLQVYREKTWNYEKQMLKEISLNDLKKYIQSYYETDFSIMNHTLYAEKMCLEIAIEAYLLGAKYSRFGYYGEKKEYVSQRSLVEMKELIETLYECMYWDENKINEVEKKSKQQKCEVFIKRWWEEGFNRGTKRLKLRLK